MFCILIKVIGFAGLSVVLFLVLIIGTVFWIDKWDRNTGRKPNSLASLVGCLTVFALLFGLFFCGFFTGKAYAGEDLEFSHIMIHHTDTPEWTEVHTKDGHKFRKRFYMDKEKCDELGKKRGFDECGYNFIVERDGVVHQARALNKQGAHCPADGMNRKAIAVAFALKGEEESPVDVQIEAVKALIGQLYSVHGELAIVYHGDHKATLCPGKYVRPIMGSLLSKKRLTRTKD
jgi:hypothetical protein